MSKSRTPPTIISITGEIAHSDVHDVQMQLLQADARAALVVRICSPGGSIGAGFGICDLLRAERRSVTTEVWGDCSSIAVAILMAGKVRRASALSRIVLHDGLVTVERASFQAKDLLAVREGLIWADSIYNQLIATRCGVAVEDVARWAKDEVRFTAQGAKAAGLIDEIIGA